MKLVAISDTHEKHKEVSVPDGDVLIHAGDFTFTGKVQSVANFAQWMKFQPHKHKIVIAGNHELTFQSHQRNIVISLLKEAGIIYLEDSGVTIDNISFWGSPWQPRYFDWAFNLDRKGLAITQKWNAIPEHTNVLITHGPPYGILDQTTDNGSQGCEMLEKRVFQLPELKAHIFGHLHHDGGKLEEVNNIKFINAAVCTDSYKPTNLPIVIEI